MRLREKKGWAVLGNTVHGIFLCFLFVCIIRAIAGAQNLAEFKVFLEQMGMNEIYTFIGAIAFTLFGVVGAYDFLYLNGLSVFVPPAYISVKEKNYVKQAEKMMEVYYKKDIDFINAYEKERTSYLLQAMGLEEKQFHYINYKIIRARTQMTEKSIFALRSKAEKILLQKEFVVDQLKIEPLKRVYNEVDYFLNYYTALYDTELCKAVGNLMCHFMLLVLGAEIEEIDYIIVPKGSNLLLGLEVGKILHKKVLPILDKGRIERDKPWDGKYETDKVNKIIVVHDVLVSGKRIYESIEKLYRNTYEVSGIFCLARYNSTEFDPIKEFEEHGIERTKIECLLDINEDVLKEVYNDVYECRYGRN